MSNSTTEVKSVTLPITLEHLQRWYERDLARYASWEKTVQIDETRGIQGIQGVPTPRSLHFYIHTDRNRYSISAREPENKMAWWDAALGKWNFDPRAAPFIPNDIVAFHMVPDSGYLGCIASSRKCRVGEDWTRGSDLPDGPLSEVTWLAIIHAILSYELLPVGKEAREALKAKVAQLGPREGNSVLGDNYLDPAGHTVYTAESGWQASTRHE